MKGLLPLLLLFSAIAAAQPLSPQPQSGWKRHPGNPIFPATPGTWREAQTANPDLLLVDSTYYLYFRGQQGGHDRIGVATIPARRFDGHTWEIHPDPVINVGAPGSWDENHALDPAAIVFRGKIFLYYTGCSPRADRAICLAISEDGIHFTKPPENPVVIGGAPEVVLRDGVLYLYYWKSVPGKKGFQIHYATSTDGIRFTEPAQSLALPVGRKGTWDSFTVETPRIFMEGGLYYMMYCGSDRHKDYPSNAGLATSGDLIHWKKYSGNPVFSRGERGSWDEGAIWFTTVEKVNGRYFMWYEGYGGGTSRTEAYGSYLKGGKSQVGMATLDAPFFYISPEAQRNDPLAELNWMVGSWEARASSGRNVLEEWDSPRGASMRGRSKTIVDGKIADRERIRIERLPDGSLAYIALPSGQARTTFRCIRSEPGIAVFENLQHDFPQRVIYRQAGSDSLLASIEGMVKGEMRRVNFPYRRVR